MTPPLGLAVSGGGDSIALLHLTAQAGIPAAVATVDHGLRPEAALEAAEVARTCATLGLPHVTLRWHWDGQGNLQDRARRARLSLLADWARGAGLSAVALGHTQDDVAETFLMRLARGAGIDGLSHMAATRRVEGVTFLRPLLGIGRAELRDWLTAHGLAWTEDPSNQNDRFARSRARKALAGMATAGITPDTLASLAARMAEMRDALDAQAAEAARHLARVEAGDVVFDAVAFAAQPAEIRRRLLLAAILWITSAEYGPRGADLIRLRDTLAAGRPATLAGCRAIPAKGLLRLTREYRAVQHLQTAADAPWDGRWQLSGADNKDLTLRALGPPGLALCPDWRATGLPRATLLASPGVWQGGTLCAAPLAGFAAGRSLICRPPTGILSTATGA